MAKNTYFIMFLMMYGITLKILKAKEVISLDILKENILEISNENYRYL